MLKYAGCDIVFQEFPDEVTLALALSLCPNRCKRCHSSFLQGDFGQPLTEETIAELLDRYSGEITCVGFMGGDNDPAEVTRLACRVKALTRGAVKTGWYSGRAFLPEGFHTAAFDYIKLGPWREVCGPLKEPTTNQRLYRVTPNGLHDITSRFWQ